MKSIFKKALSVLSFSSMTPEKAKKKLEEMGASTYFCSRYIDEPEKVRLFLIAGGTVDKSDVFKAIRYGYVESVALMLQSPGFDINCKDSLGHTLLKEAIEYRQIAIVALLLASPGIDVNLESGGYSPLSIAAKSGQSEIVALLLSTSGIDVNFGGIYSHGNPLYAAASNGRVDCVRLLLNAKGIRVDDIHVAAAKGDLCKQMILAKKNSILNRLRKVGDFFKDAWG